MFFLIFVSFVFFYFFNFNSIFKLHRKFNLEGEEKIVKEWKKRRNGWRATQGHSVLFFSSSSCNCSDLAVRLYQIVRANWKYLIIFLVSFGNSLDFEPNPISRNNKSSRNQIAVFVRAHPPHSYPILMSIRIRPETVELAQFWETNQILKSTVRSLLLFPNRMW